MEILFWICVSLVVWAYAGYPLSMYALAKITPLSFKQYHKEVDIFPTISLIVAAANEKDKILEKLSNTINLNYDFDNLEIIVTLDGSTDITPTFVRDFILAFPDRNIKLLINKKGGKESAQLAAIQQATGEICVFTDVATHLEPDTLYNITRHFADNRVGAVDGMSQVRSNGHSNEGLYLKYENWIRKQESATTGLVTAGGCLFGIRTAIIKGTKRVGKKDIPGFVPDLQSDFRSALMAKTFGYHTIIDTEAVAYFADGSPSKEFDRKHRTIVRGMNTFFHHLYLLNPFKYGLFSYTLFNHKLVKWLVPIGMMGAYISNWVLIVDNIFYTYVLLGQSFFYGMAMSPLSFENTNNLAKIISFFVVTNAAIAKAWWSYAIKKERFVSWEPTKRS